MKLRPAERSKPCARGNARFASWSDAPKSGFSTKKPGLPGSTSNRAQCCEEVRRIGRAGVHRQSGRRLHRANSSKSRPAWRGRHYLCRSSARRTSRCPERFSRPSPRSPFVVSPEHAALLVTARHVRRTDCASYATSRYSDNEVLVALFAPANNWPDKVEIDANSRGESATVHAMGAKAAAAGNLLLDFMKAPANAG